jgi:hypothetical protein
MTRFASMSSAAASATSSRSASPSTDASTGAVRTRARPARTARVIVAACLRIRRKRPSRYASARTVSDACLALDRVASVAGVSDGSCSPPIELDWWVLGHPNLGLGLLLLAHQEFEGAARDTEPVSSVNGG